MERGPKEEGRGSDNSSRSDSSFSTVEAIKAICAKNARAELDTEEQLLLFLKSWWSRIYNRPLKDPILEKYTLEELIYEFYDRIERLAAEKERLDQDSDKMEEDKEKADLDWAEQQEKKELEALKSKAATQEKEPPLDPAKDPANIAWMEEQVRMAKTTHGASFGEDIDETFDR